MRPLAPLGLVLLLGACSFSDGFTNPFEGMGGYIGDTITFRSGPNRPLAESDNIRRAMGDDVEVEPMLPESGNIWPGTPRQDPTMMAPAVAPQAAAPQASAPQASVSPTPNPVPGSSVAPQAPVVVAKAPVPVAPVSVPAPVIAPATALLPSGTAVATPQGSAVITTTQSGLMNYTLPSGATGRAINNGNGTMTLIGADGTVLTAPAPR